MVVGTGVTLGAAFSLGSSAHAAVDTITVTSLADPGDGNCATNGCTLREALSQADDGDTADVDQILFQSGLSGSIGVSGSPLPTIDEPLYRNGPGAGTFKGEPAPAKYHPGFRIFDVNAPGDEVTIEGLTVSGGSQPTYASGGGIHSTGAELTIKNSRIEDNRAGIGGGVYSYEGSLQILNSSISGNSSNTGGGIFTRRQPVLIRGSRVLGNDASNKKTPVDLPSDGGGIYASTILDTITIEDSTIAGNRAEDAGGGVSTRLSTAHIRHSTISGNHAANGGGLDLGDQLLIPPGTPQPNTLEESTVAHNYSLGGAGVHASSNLQVRDSTIAANYFGGLSGGGPTYATNTVIAGNAGGPFHDISGPTVLSFSLLQNSGGGGYAPSVIVGADPQLGPLADNGGPTQTMRPASTSPAIDRGVAAGASTDQRGQPRVFDVPSLSNAAGGDGADIGAFELQSSEYVPPPSPTNPASPNDFNEKAAIKQCKQKHPKGSKKRKKCVKKAKKRGQAEAGLSG